MKYMPFDGLVRCLVATATMCITFTLLSQCTLAAQPTGGSGIITADGSSTIYADAVHGDDENTGSQQMPVKTLSQALSIISPGQTLIVNDGVYVETAIVPSGTRDKRIHIKAAPGARPVISGTYAIKASWTLHKDKIWVADVDEPVNNVFVDARQMVLARWPNASVDKLNTMTRATMEKGSGSRLIVDKHLPRTNLTGARVNLWPGSAYLAYSRIIVDYRPGVSLSFDLPVSSSGGDPEGYDPFVPREGNKYYITGHLELLDSPGEWFYDVGNGKLFLYTENGDSPESHDVANQLSDIGLDMTSSKYVSITGISLLGCAVNADGAEDCVLDGVNVKYGDYFIDGNSYETMSHHNNHLGGNGNVWKNSTISHAAGNGIYVSGTGNTIDNCIIHDVDWSGGYSASVVITGDGNTVSNSTLRDSGRFAVYHSGSTRTKILNNDISGSSMLTSDCGAIYAWGTASDGTEIAYNFVHDNVGVGIYVDNNCSNMIVHHNTVAKNGTGITLNSQLIDCTVVNNTFISNKQLSSTYSYPDVTPSMQGSFIANNLYTGTWKLVTGEFAPVFHSNARAGVLNPDFTLPDGHPAIDAGTFVAPYTDGFVGLAPDVGALEKGRVPFTCGVVGRP